MLENRGKHKHLTKIILLGLFLVAYIILSSTIYNINYETKMTTFLMNSTLEMAKIRSNHVKNTIRREKELTSGTKDINLAEKLKGKILLQIEADGAAWYVSPIDTKRYYLGKPRDAMLTIKKLSKKMPLEEIVDYIYFEKKFPEELAGRFLLNTDEKDEYYYIHPESRLAIPLKTPNEAFHLLIDLGLGITNKDIRKITVGEL